MAEGVKSLELLQVFRAVDELTSLKAHGFAK
jgi:hypothetical protein